MNLRHVRKALLQFQKCVKVKSKNDEIVETQYIYSIEAFEKMKTIREELGRLAERVVFEYFSLGEQLDMHSKPDVHDLEPIIKDVMRDFRTCVFILVNRYSSFENFLYLRSGLQFIMEWHSTSVANRLREMLLPSDYLLSKCDFICAGEGQNVSQERRPEGIPESHYWWDVVWLKDNDYIFMTSFFALRKTALK